MDDARIIGDSRKLKATAIVLAAGLFAVVIAASSDAARGFHCHGERANIVGTPGMTTLPALTATT